MNTVAVYNCPADRSTAKEAGGTYDRVRSDALNQKLNCPESWWCAPDDRFRNFRKMSAIAATSELFTFIDEREDSIDDGAFGVDMVGVGPQAELVNIPANRHNNACGVCFADGPETGNTCHLAAPYPFGKIPPS